MEIETPTATTANVLFCEDCYIAGNAAQVAHFPLDQALPDRSGLVLAQQLRPLTTDRSLRSKLTLARLNPRDAEAAKRCGADDYHVKPVVPDEFRRFAERIISRWLPHTR